MQIQFLQKNGEEGLNLYKQYRSDIIISDINMPIMNGITMCKEIRTIDRITPIIFTTAHNDTEYLINSIEVGANFYIVKPINITTLFEKLKCAKRQLDDHNKAEEYIKEQLLSKIKLEKTELFTKLIDIIPIAFLLYHEGKIVYSNKIFNNLFDVITFEKLINGSLSLNDLLISKNGSINSFDEIQSDDRNSKKIYKATLHTQKGVKLFSVSKKVEYLLDNNIKSDVYIFQDITVQEYQKLKIKHYNMFLEDKIYKKQHNEIINKQVQQENQNKEITQTTKNLITPAENQILRRRYSDKISAIEFCNEIDYEMIDNVKELREYCDDIYDGMLEFLSNRKIEYWQNVRIKITKIGSVLNQMFEFADMAYSFINLTNLLNNIDIATFDNSKIKLMQIYISSILNDLDNWIENVFDKQTALDIHYLDASLFSSMLQLEMELTGVKKDTNEEDELELF